MDSYSLYRTLERRFDGEMPEHLRRAALAGGARAYEERLAEAASRGCDMMALAAQRAAAWRRTENPGLGAWRAQGLAWRARLASSR